MPEIEYKIIDASQANDIALLAVCLTNEINQRVGINHFDGDESLAKKLCQKFVSEGVYTVISAFDNNQIVGFGALCESHSLYAEGAFGILQELYVMPSYRSQGVGKELMNKIVSFTKSKQWKRLELCTPPIPEFDRTVEFYKDNGFEIVGGYKMKHSINN